MSSLQIWVNGQQQTTEAHTLAELCLELGHGEDRVATAVNNDFVPASRRTEIVLAEGDRVEIVSPRQGG
jgi:sulfur carrier protein